MLFESEPFVDQLLLETLAKKAIEQAEAGRVTLSGPERLERATSLLLESAAAAMRSTKGETFVLKDNPSVRAFAKGYVHQTHARWQVHRDRFARE